MPFSSFLPPSRRHPSLPLSLFLVADFVYSTHESLKTRASTPTCARYSRLPLLFDRVFSRSSTCPFSLSTTLCLVSVCACLYVYIYVCVCCVIYIYTCVCVCVNRFLRPFFIHRYQYFNGRGGRYQVRMHKNTASTAAHRVQILQNNARRW